MINQIRLVGSKIFWSPIAIILAVCLRVAISFNSLFALKYILQKLSQIRDTSYMD